MNMKDSIVLGTRGSRLALAQTSEIRDMLLKFCPGLQVNVKIITTEGDLDHEVPLSSFDGRGAFVRTIELALLAGEIDAAVHSLKDLPSQLPEGLTLGAAPLREDPRDVLISREDRELESLPSASVIATGSIRRIAQIRCIRPDITYTGIRGNIETRIRKLDNETFDAVVLAAAGLKRLGLESRISQFFEPDTVLPAPCQGALGIECRAGDYRTLELVGKIDNPDICACVDAERIFIATLGVGCHSPVGALARTVKDSIIFSGFAAYGEENEMIKTTLKTSKKNAPKDIRDAALDLKAKIAEKNMRP